MHKRILDPPYPMGWQAMLIGVPGAERGRLPANTVPLIGQSVAENVAPPWDVPAIRARIKPWVLEDFLMPYQKEGWQWSYNREGSCAWWACGSGKTLLALLWLVSGSRDEKKIVITRAPTKRQWQREAAQYTDLRIQVLEGRGASFIPPETECVVLSWETLTAWLPELRRWAGTNSALVLDEIHKGKAWKRKDKFVDANGKVSYRWATNRAAAAAKLSTQCRRRLGLTATPIRDRISDLWAQLDLIEPGCWGSNWDWIHRYCDAKKGEYGGIDTSGTSNVDELKTRLRTLTHVVSYGEMSKHLPAKRRQLVYLTRQDQSRPSAFKQDMKAAARKGKAALFEMQLMEAASRKRKWIAESVLDAVEAGQKVVVFTGRRKDAEALTKAIKTKVKKCHVPVWSGHGGDAMKHREQMVAEYAEHDSAGVFVGTTDAFGEAIDGLQHTDLAMFALLPWTPGMVTQAEGRFSRHGSTRRVLISYVVAEGTVDEHIADLLLEKLEAVEETLNDSEAGGVAATLAGDDDEEAIIDSIFTLMENTNG